jgi:hypothetical protein
MQAVRTDDSVTKCLFISSTPRLTQWTLETTCVKTWQKKSLGKCLLMEIHGYTLWQSHGSWDQIRTPSHQTYPNSAGNDFKRVKTVVHRNVADVLITHRPYSHVYCIPSFQTSPRLIPSGGFPKGFPIASALLSDR